MRAAFFVSRIGALALSALVAMSNLSSVQAATPSGGEATLTSVMRAAHFAEPLVASAPTTAGEDRALVQALIAYQQRANPEDVSSLTAFLTVYPHSGWGAALSTDLGLIYLHYGYYSRAIDAWRGALAGGKNATEPHAKALVDRAVGELARLYASLGQNDELTKFFGEIDSRPIVGSATEAIQAAKEELTASKRGARHLFNCGPAALEQVMIAAGSKQDQVDFLQWYRAGQNGTNLAEVAKLADQAKFSYRLISRKPGQPIPVPSVVHWKVGHYAAIVGEANGRFHVVDTALASRDVWVSQAAIDAEASGYFLTSTSATAGKEWRSIDKAEAATIWGKGPTNGTPPGDPGPDQDPPADGGSPPNSGGTPPDDPNPGSDPNPDPNPNPPCPTTAMCVYGIGESTVSLTLSDSPVGYTPPIGPSAKIQLTYNQREASQPAVFNFSNVSPKWSLNWLTYVTDDPTNPGANVTRYLPHGGAYTYTGYQSSSGLFAAQNNDGSILVLASQTPVSYRRLRSDGSVEIYAQSDGATSYPRNIFLTQVIDPQGNSLTLNYDDQQRLISITDAVGRQTIFTYGLVGQPLLVTQITDPFGRSATLAYDSNGRLSSITDILGLTSSLTYDANSLIDSMTTPYGTTTFSYTAPGASGPPRYLQVTDPLDYNEREEWVEPAPIPDSDPSATVPQGMPTSLTNQYLSYRDSFHWSKDAYVSAGCTPTGGCDYTKARDRHFSHVPNTDLKSTNIESVKYPLENRIWYNYPNQTSSINAGSYEKPTAVGRVLDDGTTQLNSFSYDTGGFYKLTQTTDPSGRITSYAYANHVDLSAVSQTTAYGVQEIVAQFIYNTKHRPIYYTDAAGQTTEYAYNSVGQLTSVTNPLGQTTSYQYNASNDLTSIINANNATAASFTYDTFDRIRTYTDSEGWIATYDYDAADRVTKITYPDGTTDLYTYNRLDLASYKDRLGRVWTYSHDADRRLVTIIDPLGHQTTLSYNRIGQLSSLTDPNGNTTKWSYDVEGRLSQKTYADNSAATYTFENTTSRLKSVLDALVQTKQYSYARDNRLTGITYLNAANPTPNVAFAYDSYFPRLVSMTDGNGTTQFNYVPVGSMGALRLQQEQSPLASSAISYVYDALGRLTSRTVAGAGPETFGYDAIGRSVNHTDDLGAFTLAYLGQTAQISQRQLANSTLSTSWTYLPNAGDRRLAQISDIGLSAGQYSTYQYTTTPENLIKGITESSDATPVYPSPSAQTASYNNLNQLTSLSGQALSFDANGNLLSDGQRTYTWDAENRLIGINYPAQPGKQTAFAYDGFSRRTTISSTPAGGTSITSSYIWCGARICQARNASNATTRSYYAEGEFVPGSPGQLYYYGPDQIGSVRRVFASASSAPAYSYDPFGNAIQPTAPLTDFNYAGMFFNSDSGLYLTQYRAYDPFVGRWLSRDPIADETRRPEPLIVDTGEDNTVHDLAADMPTWAQMLPSANSDFLVSYGIDSIKQRNPAVTNGAGSTNWPNGLNLYGYAWENPISQKDSTGLCSPMPQAPDGTPVEPAAKKKPPTTRPDPPPKCSGPNSDCGSGGSYGHGGIAPDPTNPGKFLCWDCYIKTFGQPPTNF